MSITIYDVAREANVSMATVSRVVNGNPNVKPATRKKVTEVIERLGYRPNAVARGLASKKTTTVGVIVPDISSIYFAELARGIEDIATMYKYNIILSNSDQNKDKEIHLLNEMLGKQVDGIVFMGGNISESHIRQFKTSSVPIIIAGTIEPTGNLPSVNINYEQATYDAVKSFTDKGHKRIVHVCGTRENSISELKIAGYRRALEEVGIEFNEDYLIEGDSTYQAGLKAFEKIVANELNPTAIFVSNDEVAIGVIHGAQDLGFSIPNDIELIGFGNTRLSLMVRPQMSSVVQPVYDIGAVAMRLLTKYMTKEKVDDHTVILPHHVEYRKTTK